MKHLIVERNSLLHVWPSSKVVNPSGHVQLNPPSVLSQVAFLSHQASPSKHSSTSDWRKVIMQCNVTDVRWSLIWINAGIWSRVGGYSHRFLRDCSGAVFLLFSLPWPISPVGWCRQIITSCYSYIFGYIYISVGTVLVFQFNPGFGTEASVTAVSRYQFWYSGSGSYFSIPGFWYEVFRGLFVFI